MLWRQQTAGLGQARGPHGRAERASGTRRDLERGQGAVALEFEFECEAFGIGELRGDGGALRARGPATVEKRVRCLEEAREIGAAFLGDGELGTGLGGVERGEARFGCSLLRGLRGLGLGRAEVGARTTAGELRVSEVENAL